MAVVQISRIQIRRGQKNQGTGLPQLASGEMAWAIDSQELFIGNGAVSEGSPAVGNTKIITQRDNLLDIANQYRYKSKSSTYSAPAIRNLEDRLNDNLNNLAYGIVSNGDDMTQELQHAIDNLYIDNRDETQRVTLNFLPGRYRFSNTIYLPSYVSIVGSGRGRTIFEYTGTTGPIFKFIDDRATRTNRDIIIDNVIFQPKNILLKGFTVVVNNLEVSCFLMESVRDSNFEEIEVLGCYDFTVGADSTLMPVDTNFAWNLESYSSIVTCKNNYFKRVKVSRYGYPFFSKHDIINNTWDDCELIEGNHGFLFGRGSSTASNINAGILGQQFGPRRNLIKNSYFNDIKETGVAVENGYGNQTNNNVFIDVGNDGQGNTLTGGNGNSIIKFLSSGNLSWGDIFDRAYHSEVDGVLIDRGLASANFNNRYYPEVSGSTFFHNQASHNLVIPNPYNSILFRIPYDGNSVIFINYIVTFYPLNQSRAGRMTVTIDDELNQLLMTEEYDYLGNPVYETNVAFTAQLGNGSVNIFCKNLNSSYPGEFSYTYSVLSKMPS